MKARQGEPYKGITCDFCGVSDMPTRFDPDGEKAQVIVSHVYNGKQINVCIPCLKTINPDYNAQSERRQI